MADAPPAWKVVPFMRVVANGVAANGALRATLIVTPEPTKQSSDLYLETWPDSVARFLADRCKDPKDGTFRFCLNVCSSDPTAGGTPIKVAAKFRVAPASNAAVNKLWRQAIEGDPKPLDDTWKLLWEDIDRSLQGDKHSAALQCKYSKLPEDPPGETFDEYGVIKAGRYDPSVKYAVKGVVPNTQSKFATETEAARSQRLAAKLVSGPYLPGDQDQEGISGTNDEPGPQDGPPSDSPTNAELTAAKQKKLYGRLKNCIAATDDHREDSLNSYNAVNKYLEDPASVDLLPKKAKTDLSVVTSHEQVLGRSTTKDRAAHIYGAWPQQSPAVSQQRAAGDKPSDCPAPDTAARVHGVYYSLQGDPMLSRFFGFAFDLEFARPIDLVSEGSVWLAAADTTAEIWTKASYRSAASGAYFWPASRFDASAKPIAALAVEQADGLFNLGLAYDPSKPASGLRYDLTSLDVRGAVSAARDAQDLGQRHRTIGWTILDRGRVDQVARDLAVFNNQIEAKKKGTAVVLHAEELTIGRRLDVAIADDTPTNKLTWRSLMNRFVEFTRIPDEARPHLERIVGDRRRDGRILDESSFQVMARSMPIVGEKSDDRSFEAIVEEAIQTWDGTPLASLACSTSKPQRATAVLPIKRAYDLPRQQQPRLRPPPLRYGVGYVFGMRSVYLGGGSLSIEEASALQAEKGGAWSLPAASSAKASPRRYLRQEAIDAPILMIPACLVTRMNGAGGVMGFEATTQAIVRSAIPPKKKTSLLAGDPPPSDYVKAADRAVPNETLRIFVAPMVGFDFASRHRVFDDPRTVDMAVRGGLIDVDFDDKTQHFPVAVVKRNTGFNGERQVYRREVGWPTKSEVGNDNSDGLGGTVFRPRQTPANRRPSHGYLPDPAAQTMSLRLRITGSDNYLEGDVRVDLYAPTKGVIYPNALPLAVSIRKRGPRKILATKISDVVTGDQNSIIRLGADDKPVPDWTGQGVRLRHLNIELAPGEQFDLEVTCLPTPTKLADWFALPEAMGVQYLAAQGDATGAVTRALASSGGNPSLAPTLTAANGGASPRTGFAGKPTPTFSGLVAISETLLSSIRNRWPLTELASPSTLHVAHAVNLPETAPLLRGVTVLRPNAEALARSPGSPAPTSASANQTPPENCPANPVLVSCPLDQDHAAGSTTMMLSGELLVDLEQTDTIDIVATVVNASGKPFDDRLRGRGLLAKRNGHWPRATSSNGSRVPIPTEGVLGFGVDAAGKATLQTEEITLLRIQALPDARAAAGPQGAPVPPFKPIEGRLTPIDLRALHQAAIAGIPIEIPMALPDTAKGPPEGLPPLPKRKISVTRPSQLNDSKARYLSLRAVALSRFANAFETAPRFSEDGKEHVLHRRQPLHPSEQSCEGHPSPVWSSSTERPAIPAAKTPAPFFSTTRSAKQDGNTVKQLLHRGSGVRLRFDRGMFSSGEGERVGIVLWPPNIREQDAGELDENRVKVRGRSMQLSNFDDSDLGDGGKFISRWGGDPIRSDPQPQKGFFIPKVAFEYFSEERNAEQLHDPLYIGSARMPVIAPQPDDSGAVQKAVFSASAIEEYLDVALLTFEPYFDIDREEWFVDVPMNLARATDPFIRFGLVRYQPNSICEDLKISPPVRVWTQLPPHRDLTVSYKKVSQSEISVQIEMLGQSSDGVKPLPANLQYLLKDLKQKEVWERLQRSKMSLRLVHEGAPTTFGRHQTEILPGTSLIAVPDFKNGPMRWSLGTTISTARLDDLGPGKVFAIVEEFEERLAASYPNEPIDLAGVLNKSSIRRSGPRFLARVPFLEV